MKNADFQNLVILDPKPRTYPLTKSHETQMFFKKVSIESVCPKTSPVRRESAVIPSWFWPLTSPVQLFSTRSGSTVSSASSFFVFFFSPWLDGKHSFIHLFISLTVIYPSLNNFQEDSPIFFSFLLRLLTLVRTYQSSSSSSSSSFFLFLLFSLAVTLSSILEIVLKEKHPTRKIYSLNYHRN